MKKSTALLAAAWLAGAGCHRRPQLGGPDIAPTNITPIAFEATAWNAGRAKTRIGMAQSLVNSRILVGKLERDVGALLGAGSQTVDWGVVDEPTRRLEWHLGLRDSAASLMFPYDEYLVLYLDAANRVVRATIRNRD